MTIKPNRQKKKKKQERYLFMRTEPAKQEEEEKKRTLFFCVLLFNTVLFMFFQCIASLISFYISFWLDSIELMLCLSHLTLDTKWNFLFSFTLLVEIINYFDRTLKPEKQAVWFQSRLCARWPFDLAFKCDNKLHWYKALTRQK